MAIPVYPSDLNDEEWTLLASLIPPAKPRGRPRSVDIRRIVNGIFYVLRTRCAWRYLPREYGPWQTVYWYFRQWRLDDTWAQMHARLRELARLHAGRDPTPSAAIIDSQSVKTLMGGMRGLDGHKQVAGRKRHILVDTEGFLLGVVVHPANLPDRAGGRLVLDAVGERFPRLQRIWADQGYTGSLVRWAAERYGLTLDVVYRVMKTCGCTTAASAPSACKTCTPSMLGMYQSSRTIMGVRWVRNRSRGDLPSGASNTV